MLEMTSPSRYLSSHAIETEGAPPPRAPKRARASGPFGASVPSNPATDPTQKHMKNPMRSGESTSQRHIATLKVVSRLLGHELKSQVAGKAISMSRDEVTEIQTTIDLYIEQASVGQKSQTSSTPVAEAQQTRMVGANN